MSGNIHIDLYEGSENWKGHNEWENSGKGGNGHREIYLRIILC